MATMESMNMALTVHRVNDLEQNLLVDQQGKFLTLFFLALTMSFSLFISSATRKNWLWDSESGTPPFLYAYSHKSITSLNS